MIGESGSDASCRGSRVYSWAMPLLGFVGTVCGGSYGIGGFAEFLSGEVSAEEIKVQVGIITEGLAVAFYTTLVGLLTAGMAAFIALAPDEGTNCAPFSVAYFFSAAELAICSAQIFSTVDFRNSSRRSPAVIASSQSH